MDAARDAFAAAGCAVLVVAQARPDQLRSYLAQQNWHVKIVSDPDRTAYRAFGLERTSWFTFFRPGVIGKYLRALARGYVVKKPYAGEDVLQLGGDFVLDRTGRILFSYRSSNPVDRPGVAAIRDAIPSARPMLAHPGADDSQVDPEPRAGLR